MDLRIVKTKKVIKEAFLTLRKKYPLEKVKVKDICDLALINKTTFYKYYLDVFDLSAELEDEAIEQFFSASKDMDCLFSAPEKFVAGIPKSADENIKPVTALFAGREDVFMKKMEHWLLDYYKKNNSDMSIEDEVKLHFVICGATHTMQEMTANRPDEEAAIAENIAGIIRKITM